MSIHKLSAGSGYDYLTRQVAALDATQKGHVGLASYYTERGESPGSWVGSGLGGIDGLNAGDPVSAEQMKALFGAGMHPLAAQRWEQLDASDLTNENIKAATQLGLPFKIYASDVSPFRVEVAKRIAARQAAMEQLGDESVSATDRARVRTEVAREFFRNQHGRDPIDAREIAATIAKSRVRAPKQWPAMTWPSPRSSRCRRSGRSPTHTSLRTSRRRTRPRCGMRWPSLNATHCSPDWAGTGCGRSTSPVSSPRRSPIATPAPETQICTPTSLLRTRCRPSTDAGWRSTDGCCSRRPWLRRRPTTPPWKHHLRDRLGIRFAERADTDLGRRPVREIVGVDPALNHRWSTRRVLIKDRQGELAARFQRDHGRPPTPVEALQLAQRATLETRDAKHEPRSLTEQRNTWHAQAAETLGGVEVVQAMITHTFNPTSAPGLSVNAEWVTATVKRVLAAVEEHRSTWQSWHVRAEAHRHIRGVQVPTDQVEQLVELLIAEVLQTRSISLTPPDDGITEPETLRRADGSSVYTVAGSDLFTSTRILAAEQRLVAAAGRTDGRAIEAETAELALLESAANGNALDAGQAAWFVPCAPPGRGCSSRSPQPAPGKPPPCQPWLRRGATAAARCSDSPRRPPRRRSSATPPTHRPKHWRNSPGPSTTMICPTARSASADPRW
jgi:TrwC relaxase